MTRSLILLATSLISLTPAAALAAGPSTPSPLLTARPSYHWDVSLERETKAAVGPIEASRDILVRFELPEGPRIEAWPDELLTVCIDDRYCENVELLAHGDSGPRRGVEVRFNHVSSPRSFLTFQRKNPASSVDVHLSIKVETDKTEEIPEYKVIAQ